MGTNHQHRLCTYAEAETAIKAREFLWVHECYCRTPAKQGKLARKYCGHALEVCMGLTETSHDDAPVENNTPGRRIPRSEALSLLESWKKQGNLFRFMGGEAVCFCCACGCGWFFDEKGNRQTDPCGKSPFIEKTDLAKCNLCGACIKSCAYEVRKIEGGKMLVDRAKCYGCSACEFACPQDAIKMAPR